MEGQKLAPWVEGLEVGVGHVGVVERTGEVEAEVVRGAEDAVGSCPRFDGENFLQDGLLIGFRDDVIEDGEDVGLLGEDFFVGVVGEKVVVCRPAL